MNVMHFGDNTMKISELCETTAGAVAAVATPIGGNKMQKHNPDGTAKNALDGDTLMAGKKKKTKNKKA